MDPGGVGMMMQVVTSNRNRIVSEIRHMMTKNGGNMAENGAVGWMFSARATSSSPRKQADEDKMLAIVLDAGAEDLRDDGSIWEVLTPPEAFEPVREALVAAGITPASAEVGWVPQELREAHGTQAQQMLRLMEALEEHDDVQHVSAELRYRRKRNAGSGKRQLIFSGISAFRPDEYRPRFPSGGFHPAAIP